MAVPAAEMPDDADLVLPPSIAALSTMTTRAPARYASTAAPRPAPPPPSTTTVRPLGGAAVGKAAAAAGATWSAIASNLRAAIALGGSAVRAARCGTDHRGARATRGRRNERHAARMTVSRKDLRSKRSSHANDGRWETVLTTCLFRVRGRKGGVRAHLWAMRPPDVAQAPSESAMKVAKPRRMHRISWCIRAALAGLGIRRRSWCMRTTYVGMGSAVPPKDLGMS